MLACAAGGLAQTSTPATAPADSPEAKLAPEKAALSAAEATHPGNTAEVMEAVDALVQKELDSHLANADTLTRVLRETEIAKTVKGPTSKEYVDALGMISEVYVGISRPAEGRPFAEQGLAIAEKAFPATEDFANAADEVGYVCDQLGDYKAALAAEEAGIAAERKAGGNDNWNLVSQLTNLADIKLRMHDIPGAGAASEESLAIELKTRPNDPNVGVVENNLGSFYVQTGQFEKGIPHLTRAMEINAKVYGPNSPLVRSTAANLGNLYSRTGQFALARKYYELTIHNPYDTVDSLAQNHGAYARSLASEGDFPYAIAEGLTSARLGRESFVLQARTLPERQALAYAAQRPRGLDTAISILLSHPELPPVDSFQEMVRSRALVADEMARREKNLNASNDPEVARLLAALNQARTDLLAVEHKPPPGESVTAAVAQATQKMETIERSLAEHSAAIRSENRIAAVDLDDLRKHLPPGSVLISYVWFSRRPVGVLDPTHLETWSYMAFAVHPDGRPIRLIDLGESKPIDDLVAKARSAADAEAHSGGLGSTRNERNYRDAAEALRKKIWDPIQSEVGSAKLVLVVPDGMLNLIPFSSLPQGSGYLVEHGPVIHTLSSERDLLPTEDATKKSGLLAIGSPQFELAGVTADPATLRGGAASCDDFRSLQFNALPGTMVEVSDIASSWQRWNSAEPESTVTGADATRARFLQEASRHRVLHVATHAFLLDQTCGNGNPLLQSGLVFAGANLSRDSAVVTAQQIASLDLSGVDWAVLSACNTGNGVLRSGEGILGLERAFRVAGAHSVIMTLWPVDDDSARLFMHELYADRLGSHQSTADAVWNSARKLLLDRRKAGLSTHPWYWAGFVGSGGWE